MSPRVSVIVVTHESRGTIDTCLDSVARELATIPHEVIVLDNASGDGTADHVARRPGVRLLRSPVNLGFAAGNNRAFRAARGRFLLLLNPDARLVGGDLRAALGRLASDRRIALLGGRVRLTSGRDGESAHRFPGFLRQWLVRSGAYHRLLRGPLARFVDPVRTAPRIARAVDWIPGAFLLLRRATAMATGGFDERFFLYWEEVDLCRRLAQSGRQVRYEPDLVVIHDGGESARQRGGVHLSEHGTQLTGWQWRSAWLYYRKHHGATYARAMYALECAWQRLRVARARAAGRRNAAAEHLLAQLRASWRDTRGGRVSPPRPWRLENPPPPPEAATAGPERLAA